MEQPIPRSDEEMIEAALAAGLRAAKQGEEALQDFLATLEPEVRQEVAPLLQVALTLQAAPEVQPRPAFRRQARRRLLRRIRPPWFVTFWRDLRLYGRSSTLKTQRRFAMTWIVVLVAMVTALLGGGGAVYASESALPGEALYPVKMAVEEVQLALAGPEQDVNLLAQFTQRRLEEVQALAAQGRHDEIPVVMARYQEQVQAMIQEMAQMGQPDPEVVGQSQAMLAQHLQVLQGLAEQVPSEARPALEHALQVSQQGLEMMQQHGLGEGRGTPGPGGQGPMGSPMPGGSGGGMGTPMGSPMPGGNGNGMGTPMGSPMPGGSGNGMGTPMWSPMPGGNGNWLNTPMPGGNGSGMGNGGMGGGH
ncbi:MAG TPA: hypothetical protein G4O04_09380 [Anaerolineae bacterium]|nr:hypothetical protein [Anaerolineae bacterium]HIQ08935.1 hypothetical protein [Anaerolineaceae bacterium]